MCAPGTQAVNELTPPLCRGSGVKHKFGGSNSFLASPSPLCRGLLKDPPVPTALGGGGAVCFPAVHGLEGQQTLSQGLPCRSVVTQRLRDCRTPGDDMARG